MQEERPITSFQHVVRIDLSLLRTQFVSNSIRFSSTQFTVPYYLVCQKMLVLFIVADECDNGTGYAGNIDFNVFRNHSKIRSSYIHVSRECENVHYITQEFVEVRILTLVSDGFFCLSPSCFNKLLKQRFQQEILQK